MATQTAGFATTVTTSHHEDPRELKKQIAVLDRENTQLHAKLLLRTSTLTIGHETATSRCQDLEAKLATLQDHVDRYSKLNERLIDSNTRHKATVAQLEATAAETMAERDDLAAEVDEQHRVIESLQADSLGLVHRVKELEAEVVSLKAKAAKLQAPKKQPPPQPQQAQPAQPQPQVEAAALQVQQLREQLAATQAHSTQLEEQIQHMKMVKSIWTLLAALLFAVMVVANVLCGPIDGSHLMQALVCSNHTVVRDVGDVLHASPGGSLLHIFG